MFYLTLVTGTVWVIADPYDDGMTGLDTLENLIRSTRAFYVTVLSREGYQAGFNEDGSLWNPVTQRVAINTSHIVSLERIF